MQRKKYFDKWLTQVKSEDANPDLRAQSLKSALKPNPSQICTFNSPLYQKGVNSLCTLIKKLPHVEKLGGRPGSRGSILLTYKYTFSQLYFLRWEEGSVASASHEVKALQWERKHGNCSLTTRLTQELLTLAAYDTFSTVVSAYWSICETLECSKMYMEKA